MSAIEDKLRKLIAMAEHATSNPNEAANAAAMAASLAAAHNIDLAELQRAGVQQRKEFVEVRASWHLSGVYASSAGVVGTWIARMFGCKVIAYSWKSETTFSFTGQRHNVELAHSWLDYVWKACLRANGEHARASKYGSSSLRQQARINFRHQFCIAVAERLRTKFLEMSKPPAGSDSRALVVGAWFEQKNREVEEWVKQQKGELRPMKARSMSVLVSAAIAGREAGARVGLHDQLGGGSARKGVA